MDGAMTGEIAAAGGFLLPLIQNAAYDILKWGVKKAAPAASPLTSAMYEAAKGAASDFYERFGNEFGAPHESFLASQKNWNLIMRSLFTTTADISAGDLDLAGFVAKPVSSEAVEYFLNCLQYRIKGNLVLDQHFAEKKHFKEQSEANARGTRLEDTLLLLVEETTRGRETLASTIQTAVRSSLMAFDAERQKEAVYSVIDDQIDSYRDLIHEKQPLTAIRLLEKLKAQKWADLPDRHRFRILTNIAAAKLTAGIDKMEAAHVLLQAEKLAPQDKKAILNSVIAHWIQTNIPAAVAKAREAVTLFPDEPEAYRVLLVALSETDECLDPVALIPQELLSTPELCLQIGDFFQRRENLPESRRWMRRAYDLAPNNADIEEAFATSLLDELFSEHSVTFGRQISPPQRKHLEQARDILSGLWLNAKDTELSARYVPCVINLSNAERLLGNNEVALALLNGALLQHRDHIPLKKQLCHCLFSAENPDQALQILTSMPDDAFEGKLLMQAETLALLGRTGEALAMVERVLIDREGVSPTAVVIANRARVQLLKRTEGRDAAVTAAVNLTEDDPENPEYLVQVCDLLNEGGEKDEALRWLERAKHAAIASGDFLQRSLVADTYSQLGLHREAAGLYRDLITSYEDSKTLRRLLASYLSGDCRAEALDLVTRLPEQVKELRFYSRACVELFYRLGNLPRAKAYLEKLVMEAPDDLELQLNMVILLERMGEKDAVRQSLQALPAFLEGSPEDYVKLSHAYARFGFQDEALRVGYETLRRFGDHPGVHLGYCGLILAALKDVAVIDRVRNLETVEIDTAFTCMTQDGKRLTYVIEANHPNFDKGEFGPEHGIAKKAVGLKVKDSFVIAETPAGPEEATITEVKHKYLHALHDSMSGFQYRFPGFPGMWMVSTAPTGDGEINLKPLLDLVSRRSHAVQDLEDFYAKNPAPLALLAHALNTHPVDCLLGLSGRRRVPIKCCNGDAKERTRARQAVAAGENGLIMDPFSLFTLHSLQLLDIPLRVSGGNIGITQSTLDLLAELVEVRKTMGPHLSLSQDQGRFYGQEVTAEGIQATIAPLEELLLWCRQNCHIIPAAGKPNINQEGKLLFSELHPAFLDTLLAASGTGRLLISEDLHYRQVAALFFDVKGTWIQPLLQSARDAQYLTAERYHMAVLRLVQMGFSFISVAWDDLTFHLRKPTPSAHVDFCTLLDTFADRNVDLFSAIDVASGAVCSLLQQWIPNLEKAIYSVLTRLTSHPAATQMDILAILSSDVCRKIFFADGKGWGLFCTFVFNWCKGHFLPLDSTSITKSSGKSTPVMALTNKS